MANVVISCVKNPLYQKVAMEMAAVGWTVFCGIADPVQSDELTDAGIIPIALDVTCENSVADAIKNIMKSAGHLDHIFVTSPVSSFGVLEEHDATNAHHQFEVNLFGAIRLLSAFGPFLRGQNAGGFTIFSAGILPDILPMAGWHNACEAAIASIALTAQIEFASFNVAVNHLEVGLTGHSAMHGNDIDLDSSGHATAYGSHVNASMTYLKAISKNQLGWQEVVKSTIDLVQHSVLARKKTIAAMVKPTLPAMVMDLGNGFASPSPIENPAVIPRLRRVVFP